MGDVCALGKVNKIYALVLFKEPVTENAVAELVERIGGKLDSYMDEYFKGRELIKGQGSYYSMIIIPDDKVAELKDRPEVHGVYTGRIPNEERVSFDSPYHSGQHNWEDWLMILHNDRAERAENDKMSQTLSDMFEGKT